MGDLVQFTKSGNIGVITINNPPVNALSPGVPEGISESIDQLHKDDGLKAAVLIGGGSTFIAGADIKELAKMALSKQTGPAWLSQSHLGKFLDVRAGNKSTAASDQNGSFQPVVFVQLVDGLRNPFRDSRTQRVYRRIVDGDDADVPGLRKLNKISHDRLSTCLN